MKFKAVLYRDTVSVDTGSRHFFGSVSVSKRHSNFICIANTSEDRETEPTQTLLVRGDAQMTSALGGREGVSRFQTKGREVA